MDLDDDDDQVDEGPVSPEPWLKAAQELQERLQNLQTCSESLSRHRVYLHEPMVETSPTLGSNPNRFKKIAERARLLRIESDAMLDASLNYKTGQRQEETLDSFLQNQHEQTQKLENVARALSQQVHILLVNQREDDSNSSASGFYPSGFSQSGPTPGAKRQRRMNVQHKPEYPLSLWSIMRNCIGKDLTKIPVPVNFSEPLSMLQRLTEDYEYAEILDAAADCSDPYEQLALVAAFTVSSYSTTSSRTGKPFNPLLGETYECDRTDDFGWRAISEQVSHHPPMVAQFCEGRGWKCWQEFTMTSKFRGKYLQITPLGMAYVEFLASGNKYSWRKVTTTVNNIIVGRLWVDQHGEMDIIGDGNAEGIKCHLKYIPYSYFTAESQRKVKGTVINSSGVVKWYINGTWDDKIEIQTVTGVSGSAENPIYETGEVKLAWKRRMPPPDSDKYYGFTTLAAQLNEPEEGVAPTDSRLRPDQRLMEDGKWDEANAEKIRLEEKQRAARRLREAEEEKAALEGRPYPPYEPVWFKEVKDEDSGVVSHVYNNSYWEAKARQDWSMCPDIF